MEDYTLGRIESKFANIVWENAPISTNQLIKLCMEELGWKRTTTYTVLKKMNQKGLFKNQSGTVVVLMTKEEFYARQSEHYVEQSFGGSLPGFLTAFTSRKKLTKEEIDQLQKIINENQ